MSASERTRRGAKEKKARHDNSSPFSRLQARGGQLLGSLAELRKTIIPEGEPSIESLLAQIDKLRGTISRRAQETGRDIGDRAEQMLGDLEREALRRFGPMLTRANVLSRADVAPLASRIAYLEGRLGTLLDDRAALTSRVLDLEHNLEEAGAIANEREHETNLALSAGNTVQQSLTDVRGHLDALSKDQVSRSLEARKLQDRLVRLEMRLGDVLKEQGARVTDKDEVQRHLMQVEDTLRKLGAELDDMKKEHGASATDEEDLRQRFARVNDALKESARTLQGAATKAAAAIEATRDLDTQLDTLRDERAADRGEFFQLAHRIDDVECLVRQYDLRLGDLTERYTAGREELASLVARLSQLELAAARPATATGVAGHAEGH